MTEDRNFADEQVMARLVAANPVDADHVESAQSPQARQLLEELMNQSRLPSEPSPTKPWGTQPDLVDIDDVVANADRSMAPRRPSMARRLPLLAAAALVAVAGVALLLWPSNSSEAAASVQQAAKQTAAVDSGGMQVEFQIDVAEPGGEDNQTQTNRLEGEIDGVYSGSDLQFTVDLSEPLAGLGGGGTMAAEIRVIDEVVYLEDGGQWLSLNGSGFLAQSVSGLVHPREVLGQIAGVFEVEEVGLVTIDGMQTTHYRSTIDLDGDSITETGWLLGFEFDVAIEGWVEVDVYLGSDQMVKRLELSGRAVDPDGSGEAIEWSSSVLFTELGEPVSIEVPDGVTPLSGLDVRGN